MTNRAGQEEYIVTLKGYSLPEKGGNESRRDFGNRCLEKLKLDAKEPLELVNALGGQLFTKNAWLWLSGSFRVMLTASGAESLRLHPSVELVERPKPIVLE